MKKILLVLVLGFFAVITDVKADQANVAFRSGRNDVLYFKVKKKMIGATVEVLNDRSEVIATQVLETRKNMIVFLDEKPGRYTIRISGKGKTVEYVYLNDKHIPK